MKNGFIKVAAASPSIRVANCKRNVQQMIAVARRASDLGTKLIVFPELSITSASCGDLFASSALLNGALDALNEYIDATADLDMVSVVGLPYKFLSDIYNCAVVCAAGNIIGVEAKTKLSPAERRVFTSGDMLSGRPYCYFRCAEDRTAALGVGNAFAAIGSPELCFDLRFGEEALSDGDHGAAITAVLAASPEGVCTADNRRTLIRAASASHSLGIIYANAGYGESSTDKVFSAHNIICEGGSILAEALPFELDSLESDEDRLIISELDLEALGKDKRDCFKPENVFYGIDLAESETTLTRKYPMLPFVPEDRSELFCRCETILKIQSTGLRRRMEAAYAKKLIIGISGGLDSTLALLVAAKACDDAKRPRRDIIGITMPCFGTTNRTKSNAEILCKELGIEFRTVMIGESVKRHFEDIGHDINDKNVVYENAQARERTQVLMDIANAENGLVVGTGDMSELALGWATYNGDHMSMYGVNASIPKTLVRALTAHCADQAKDSGNTRLSSVLRDIIDTPVSPELLPADGDNIKQKTEDLVGPYEIHDFYLYYMLRYGFSPEKLFRIACHTLGDVYSPETLMKWLEVFVKRFFSQQYKRSCLPDGPAVGSVSLSPRGGLNMPSDASAALWKAEIEALKAKM